MKIFPAGTALAMALIVCSMLVIGCTQSQGAAPKEQPGGSTVAVANKVNSMMADTKTAYEKNQVAIAKAIADGTYTGNETYAYHSGNETVTFSVTVEGGIVKNATVTPHNPNMMSARIIGNFGRALPDLVAGKRIDQLSIPKNVAGNSLTTAAFKQYIEGLASQQ